MVLFFVEHAGAQPLGYKSFKLEEDNEPFKINTLFKASEGLLYAGTTNGLYSFDGIGFKRISFAKSANKDTVTAIFQDNKQQLWVGFKSGRIARKINSRLEYYEPEEGTPKSSITAFLQDKENNIWFATNNEGVYFFSGKHLYLIDTTDGMSDTHVHALALADNGDVLAATDQGINCCTIIGSKKTVRVIGPKNGLPDYYVTTIFPAGGDKFWIGLQEKGFCLYDHKTGTISLPPAATAWTFGQVNSLLVSQNCLWIATDEKGLLKQQGINEPISLVSLTGNAPVKTNNLLQDNEGNIWMNTPGELVSTAGEKLKLYTLYDKKIFESIHAVLSDYRNNYWVSTDGGLIEYRLQNGAWAGKPYRIAGMKPKTDITSLYQDAWHNIWIGTMGNGIFILDPSTGRFRNLDENPLLRNASILSITGRGGTVCAGGLEGVAMIFELSDANKTIDARYNYTNYNNITNIGNNYIYYIFKDSRGRIWFGTDGKGITVLENGQFTHYGKENGLKDDHIYSFTEDKKGTIWFNTEDAGIYSFNGRSFVNYAASKGVSNMKISTIRAVPTGNIVLVNQKGIDVLNVAAGTMSYLNNKQGIAAVNTELGTVGSDSSGNVIFCTAAGIVKYSPMENTFNRPGIIIDNVQLFLNDIDKNTPGDFNPDENSLTFNFTGIYYTNPEEVRYQYKLEGLDSNWIMTRDRNITFLRLQPGKYTFHVRASLNDDFTGAIEATYTFAVQTPLWKRAWFIILVVLLTGGLIYLYMKTREAQLKKMQQLQQEKIQFQFQVLRNQVNPHFLFNSFNTLISTIEENPAMAVGYVEQLSEFFRNIVNYRDKDIITLGEDISLMQTYFFLQQKRYGANLIADIRVPEEVKAATFIPPLTLQLLLENAIKHNAISRETPLNVELYIQDGKWLIMRNNINPKLSPEVSSGMGLQNIISRYNLLTSIPVRIDNDGVHFSVILPTLKQL